MNIIESFSYKENKLPVMQELEKIARREGKKKSEFIVSILEEYVKAHASGNTTFKLDNWNDDPTFQAIPTILSDSQKWYSYLQTCDKQDLLRILKSANTIRQYAITLDKQVR